MADAKADRRSADRKKAEQIYLQSDGKKLLKEIASECNLPDSRIRKWKSLDKWDEKLKQKKAPHEIAMKMERCTTSKVTKKVERSTSKAPPAKRSKGGQKGNKNAAGNKGGAPKGSKNAQKEGIFDSIYFSMLSPEEKQMLGDHKPDPVDVLQKQIDYYTIREYRIMTRLTKMYEEREDRRKRMVAVQTTITEQRRVFDGTPEEKEEQKALYDQMIQDKIDEGKRMPGREVQTITMTVDIDRKIDRAEQELSTVQRAKTQALKTLADIQAQRSEMAAEADDMVGDFLTAFEDGDDDE